jgi:hypothetical protein
MINIEEHDFTISNKMLFPSFAPDTSFIVNKKLIRKELTANKCLLLRYISDFDNPAFSNFWYIIKDEFIPIEGFSKNTRNQVKKGLKNCEVKKVSLVFFRANCYEIYASSIKNYGQSPISKNEFQNANYENEERDFWVVFSKETNVPIAYSSNKVTETSCNYTYIKYHTDFQNLYPSYALHYEMDRYYLEDNKVNYVNVGARSLLHETGVQDFLIQKFKYRRAYCKLNIVYSPFFRFMVKFIYPFRGLIKKINLQKLNKVKAILNQHEISSQ